MRTGHAIAVFAVAAASLVASAVHAQAPDTARDDEAHRVFEAASTAFDAGRYDEALRLFTDAYDISQRPALLYNIGLCHDRLRHDREALDAFQRFLAAEPDAPERANVEGRVRALQDAIARAPTPRETARTVVVVHDLAPPRSVPVTEQWWFWTIIGVAVVGAVVGIVLAAVLPGSTQAPLSPTGGLFTALSVP